MGGLSLGSLKDQFTKSVIDGGRQATRQVLEGALKPVRDGIKEAQEKASDGVSAVRTKGNEAIHGTVEKARSGAKDANGGNDVVGEVKEGAGKVVDGAKEVGGKVVDGVKEGAQGAWSWIKDKAKDIPKGEPNNASHFLDSNSDASDVQKPASEALAMIKSNMDLTVASTKPVVEPGQVAANTAKFDMTPGGMT